MDQADQDIKDLIEILRKRLDLEVQDLEPTQADKVRKDVESFISRIEQHPDRLDFIDFYLAAIEMQYVKQDWRKAVYKKKPTA